MRLLIDGYNLLFARGRSTRSQRLVSVSAARKALLDLLVRYKAATGHSVAVFFDGTPHQFGFRRRERVGGVDIIFSYPDTTADEALMNHLEVAQPRTDVQVVTSDNSLKRFAKRMGAKVMDCAQFMRHLRRVLHKISEKAEEQEPREKLMCLSPGEVDYWVRLFSQLAPKSG